MKRMGFTGLARQLAVPDPLRQSGPTGRVHMVGIGGSGMRALGEVLRGQGWSVRGSDVSAEACAEVRACGFAAFVGHDAGHLNPATELVVHSAAVGRENPELVEAARLRIPIVNYAEMLGRLMVGPHRLAVAGTHGKSTITAMTAEILRAAGQEPTVVCGARPLAEPGTPGQSGGRGQPVLVEACEYQGNFLHLRPNRAVISRIEPDHFDCYPTHDSLVEAFAEFVKLMPDDGLLITPAADSVAQLVAKAAACRQEMFGGTEDCDWRATEVESKSGHYSFTLSKRGRSLGRVLLGVVGRQSVLNALAAAALAASTGATAANIVTGLSRFAGLKRRMEYVGRRGGCELWDDYAHHPTAIAAAVATMREIYPHARLCVVFEPHQASRTAALFNEFAFALSQFDLVAVTDIFRAREEGIKIDVTAGDLAQRVRKHGTEVLDEHDMERIEERLLAACPQADVIVTMGAGLIQTVAKRLKAVGKTPAHRPRG